MTPYFAYIIHFFNSLFIGGLFCIGLWISRGGEMEEDNKTYKWRMIFYPFYRWLTNPYKECEFYFEYEMEKLIGDINKWFPDNKVGYLEKLDEKGTAYKISESQKYEWNKIACELEDKYAVKIYIWGTSIQVWKEYERVNEWAKPIIGCYKCYASFWGTILFWTLTSFAIKTNFIIKDYSILIPMWVVYCFSLVVVNVLLEKITDDQ